jgi:hypothetical protein
MAIPVINDPDREEFNYNFYFVLRNIFPDSDIDFGYKIVLGVFKIL